MKSNLIACLYYRPRGSLDPSLYWVKTFFFNCFGRTKALHRLWSLKPFGPAWEQIPVAQQGLPKWSRLPGDLELLKEWPFHRRPTPKRNPGKVYASWRSTPGPPRQPFWQTRADGKEMHSVQVAIHLGAAASGLRLDVGQNILPLPPMYFWAAPCYNSTGVLHVCHVTTATVFLIPVKGECCSNKSQRWSDSIGNKRKEVLIKVETHLTWHSHPKQRTIY